MNGRALLKSFWSAAALIVFVSGPAYARILNCEQLLDTPDARATQRRLIQIYADDADVRAAGVAYLGVSHADFLRLLNEGRLVADRSKLLPFLEPSHPSIGRLVRRVVSRQLGLDRGPEPRHLAGAQARSRTLRELLQQRFPKIDMKNPHVVDIMANLEYGPARPTTFSPTFWQISAAAEKTLISTDERAGRLPRTYGLARLFKLTGSDVTRAESPGRRALVAAFADLPSRAGFVLTLGEAALTQIKWSREVMPYLNALDVAEVVSIEATSPTEEQFLEHAVRVLNIAPHDSEAVRVDATR